MPHYGLLHQYKFEDIQDVRGAEVYGVNNEKLGAVDDVIFDHSTGQIRYVVVATDGWLASRKFLVPMDRIEPYGTREDKFYAELDKERIQMLPEFNQEALKSEGRWADYEKHYYERWNRPGEDQPGLQEPGVYVLDRVPDAETNADLNEPLNTNYGRRWIDFQHKLHEGRDKVVSDCPLCGTQDKAA